MPLAAGTRLGPYEVLASLGAGGMGEVYQARDARLDRMVAVKVVGASTDNSPAMRDRLLREARAASALNHPHICTIHDVGEVNGRPFIAMEWLDGESLADCLSRTASPVPLDELLRLAAQMADGLEAAHARGIVHRDLKPANLFITRRGDAKILDFGLAKLIRATDPSAGGSAHDDVTAIAEQGLTRAGEVLGTVSYMSPEQARGEPVDTRSDLFSLGAVLYEMATGRPPFTAATTALTFDAILNRQPTAPSAVNPTMPPAVDRIVERLLAKAPSGRYSSASALRADLESLRQNRTRRSSDATSAVPSVAVLPFTNVSPDAENEYIADGITEEIINVLAQVRGLQVAARTSSFSFKGRTPDLAEVGTKLHVAYVVTGSVRRAGPKLRVTAQLVSATDGFQIWSERYDRLADDIFQIQDEIATAVARKLRVALGGEGGDRLVKWSTENVAAYELYLKGKFLVNQRGASLVHALDYFEQAIALDGKYAPARAGLANALALIGLFGYAPGYEAMPRARREALAAIDQAPSLAEAHASLMLVTFLHDWDWPRAEREFQAAVALDERLTNAYQFHSLHMAAHGRFKESIEAAMRAVEIDPLSGILHAVLALAFVYAGDYDRCIAPAERAIELDPRIWTAERVRVIALWQRGGGDEALAQAEKLLDASLRHHWIMSDLAEIYAGLGRHDEVTRLVDEIEDRERTGYVPAITMATMLANAGRDDEAFAWLQRAYREHDPFPVWNCWPIMPEPFARDARFSAILKRVGLPPRQFAPSTLRMAARG